MESPRCSLDVVVVGAGLAGLAAAIACALSGHKIIVLEGAKQLAEVCQIHQAVGTRIL